MRVGLKALEVAFFKFCQLNSTVDEVIAGHTVRTTF
jgi:hypothetical protein